MTECCKKLEKEVFNLQCYEPKTSIRRQNQGGVLPRKPNFIVVVIEQTTDECKAKIVKKILDSHCCNLYKYFSITSEDPIKRCREILSEYAENPLVDFIHFGGLTSFDNEVTTTDLIDEYSGRDLTSYLPLFTQFSTQNADNNTIQGIINAKSHFYFYEEKSIYTILSTSSSSSDALNVALNRILVPEAKRFLQKKYKILNL